LKPIFQLS